MTNIGSTEVSTRRKVTGFFRDIPGCHYLVHWKERTLDDMQFLKLILLTIMVVAACSKQEKQKESVFEKYEVHESTVFLSPEIADFVGMPVHIKAETGALYFTDNSFDRVTKVDLNGQKLFSFGSEGRGPGEFQSLSGFWKFEDRYLIYDYNGFKFITYDFQGDPVSDIAVDVNPVNPDGFPPNIPLTVEAISPHLLLIPSRGRNNSLFAIADIKNDHLSFLGSAVGDFVENYNRDEIRQSHLRGEIPEIFVNFMMLSHSSNGIYAFQQTTGILEKYSHSGELIWEVNIKHPVQEGMFSHFADENRESVRSGEPALRLYKYAKAMDANEEGVAVLLNTLENNKATVIWVSDDGETLAEITYQGINNELIGRFNSFTFSPEDSRAWFLNQQYGEIYSADWPL